MTKEETQGFDEKPGAASSGAGEDAGAAAGKAAGPGAPAGGGAGGNDDDKGAGRNAKSGGGQGGSADQLREQLNERTKDLQRLQAEYQNYRKRVERDRVAVREIAIANLLEKLLPVLDDIGRARDHGELTGGFKSVSESLETVVAKLGLQQFGKEGEPFDPQLHEALMHSYSSDVTETTCVQILQPGYRIGDRTIRVAMVAVAEPQPGASADGEASSADSSSADSGESADSGKGDGADED
ncbi:nucleotide exchange factor GrpE [Phaeacidiphilus oryzae]|uniref:nucleotide exchange factor GrpE n=1 Tax=Phaeacidiphilus oryzae TaxID=348818 RepID=UPI0006918889